MLGQMVWNLFPIWNKDAWPNADVWNLFLIWNNDTWSLSKNEGTTASSDVCQDHQGR